MVERLKQIWGGFEKETTRNLTGRGVDNIQVPQRHWRAEAEPATMGAETPAKVAFDALKAKLAASRKGKTRADGDEAEASFVGDSEAARDLIRGLKSTEARIVRAERLYTGEGVKEKRSLFGGKGGKGKKSFLLF
jgi:hypothetical protein